MKNKRIFLINPGCQNKQGRNLQEREFESPLRWRAPEETGRLNVALEDVGGTRTYLL